MADFADLPSTRMVLICNAQDAKSDPVRFADHDDLGLSPEGRRQAESLRNRLAATRELAGTARLITSRAHRAVETAAIISPAVGGLTAEASCGFCEPHCGECDGMVVDEWLATMAPQRLAHWSPYSPKSPGGESLRGAIERAARAIIETIIEHAGETVVVVTHTVPLRASLWTFLSLPFHGVYCYPEFTYTGITEYVADGWLPGSGQMKANLIRYNDHAHLQSGLWSS